MQPVWGSAPVCYKPSEVVHDEGQHSAKSRPIAMHVIGIAESRSGKTRSSPFERSQEGSYCNGASGATGGLSGARADEIREVRLQRSPWRLRTYVSWNQHTSGIRLQN
jgi:hypothetical protein